MAGESYGVSATTHVSHLSPDHPSQGRYLPVFASAVYDGNKALIADGQAPINLQSVMIGNGMTDTCEFILALHASLDWLTTAHSQNDGGLCHLCELSDTVALLDMELTSMQQCTIHGGLNTTLASIEQCVSFSEAVSPQSMHLTVDLSSNPL